MTKDAVIELWENYSRIGRVTATMAGVSAAALLAKIEWIVTHDTFLIKVLITFALACFLLSLFVEMIVLGNIYAYISRLRFNSLPESRSKELYSSLMMEPAIDRPKELKSIARFRGYASPFLIVLGWGASLLMIGIIIWMPQYA